MSTVEILQAARAIIADPERWLQGGMCKLKDGTITDDFWHDAACWCAEGAIRKVTDDNRDAVIGTLAVFERANGEPPHLLNDAPETTHADVLAAFDRAIAEAT